MLNDIQLEQSISDHFTRINQYQAGNIPSDLKNSLKQALDGLNSGTYRVAEKTSTGWQSHVWLKQAILLYFKTQSNQSIDAGYTCFYDKVPLKYQSDSDFSKEKVRVVPHALVRYGSYIGANCVLMPSYVNIGAHVDDGCMIDTWATIGSAAQIGKNVHISGGAGIGGVLEPLQASPTIIEDNCFIGARSEIVEGVVVEHDSVIAMGVFISQSTPIYDRHSQQISYGRIPAGSVVIPGSLPSKDGLYSRSCALIVKQVDAQTRQKVAINDLLRLEA